MVRILQKGFSLYMICRCMFEYMFDFLCIRLAQDWKQNLGNGWKWYKTIIKSHPNTAIFNPTWTYIRPGPNWMHHEHHHLQSPANQSRHCKAKGHIFRCLWNFQVKTTSRFSVGKNEKMCWNEKVPCSGFVPQKSIFVGLEIVETSMFCSVPSCKAGQTELHLGNFAEKVKTPYQPIQCDKDIWKDAKFINLCINSMAALSAIDESLHKVMKPDSNLVRFTQAIPKVDYAESGNHTWRHLCSWLFLTAFLRALKSHRKLWRIEMMKLCILMCLV